MCIRDSGWPEQLQEIDALHIRQTEPYTVRHALVEENGPGDKVPDLGDKRSMQRETVLR